MNASLPSHHRFDLLKRNAAWGSAIGGFCGLAMFASRAAFDVMELRLLWAIPLCAFVGTLMGFMLWQHRERDCPRCGVSMGKAHGLPSRAESGGMFYHCTRCDTSYPAIPMANAELARPRTPLDPELDS